MATMFLLGIDNGGTVAKAALFSLDGREVAVAAEKTETLSPAPGWTEFDMDKLWSAVGTAVRQVLAASAIDPRQIACVACTGHGNGIYLVDAADRPVRPAIFSADSRARSYVERWTDEGIGRAVRPKTMQSLWPGQPNALLAWLRDHEPQAYARSRWVLMCKDFVRLKLTGEAAAELTDMSGTSLMDVGAGRYDRDLLDQFGIADAFDKLPPLRRSADICGQVTPAAAAAHLSACSTCQARMESLAEPLYRADVRRLNVSLDSLRPEVFKQVTGGDLDKVLRGIAAARADGFAPIRVNTVVMRGVNADQIVDSSLRFLAEAEADKGIALDREFSGDQEGWGITDGSAGLRRAKTSRP